MKNKYTFVDDARMDVLKALLSGHTLNVGSDAFRYYHKGNVVRINEESNEEFVATESQLFQRLGNNDDYWIGLTGDLSQILSIINRASDDEVTIILSNFSHDMMKRSQSASRTVQLLNNKLMNDEEALDSFLVNCLGKDTPQKLDSALYYGLYDELQVNNDFPLTRTDFLHDFFLNEESVINQSLTKIFERVDHLVSEEVLMSVSVHFDATPHYQLAK